MSVKLKLHVVNYMYRLVNKLCCIMKHTTHIVVNNVGYNCAMLPSVIHMLLYAMTGVDFSA